MIEHIEYAPSNFSTGLVGKLISLNENNNECKCSLSAGIASIINWKGAVSLCRFCFSTYELVHSIHCNRLWNGKAAKPSLFTNTVIQ